MMNSAWMETADLAAGRGALGTGLVVAGLAVLALLIGMFVFGSRRVRNSTVRRPRPEEQPRMPEGGPVREVREHREPDEVPRDGERRLPHELEGTAPSAAAPAPRGSGPAGTRAAAGVRQRRSRPPLTRRRPDDRVRVGRPSFADGRPALSHARGEVDHSTSVHRFALP
ncbi:hypothetical protein SHKM778_39560 [Streptomyces sp. KM77-8]|uniref:Uncharacterized protein n=1 Tax=Streptomyces haneummycinicus TaxID=3074435 RepID=A0AAT9HJM1_9ACTN